MFDWWILLTIVYGLYFVECLVWVDRASWACFTVPVGGVWRCTRGSELPGNDRGGLLLTNPLSASPAVVVTGLWPISISPAGISNVSAGSQTTVETPVYVAFTEMRTVRADVSGLYVNGKLLARASLPMGTFLAGLIESCRKADVSRREVQIREAFATATEARKVLTRWAECCQQVRVVLLSATFLFWYTLAFAPAVILIVGPYPTWPWLLSGLVMGTVITATQYFKAHGKLYPSLGFERWVQATAMILLPLGGIRAAVNLSRHALEHYSPFAVLPSLCGPGIAARELRVALWDLQRLPPVDSLTPELTSCVEWCAAATVSAASAAISKSKIDIHAAPGREDDGSLSYCPRCHAQFKSAGVTCHLCDDVRVLPFEAP